jgi:hypothetical protein
MFRGYKNDLAVYFHVFYQNDGQRFIILEAHFYFLVIKMVPAHCINAHCPIIPAEEVNDDVYGLLI